MEKETPKPKVEEEKKSWSSCFKPIVEGVIGSLIVFSLFFTFYEIREPDVYIFIPKEDPKSS